MNKEELENALISWKYFYNLKRVGFSPEEKPTSSPSKEKRKKLRKKRKKK